MYLLHIANKNYSSWSLRPWVLMHTLGIAFEESLHPFTDAPNQHFDRFSPNGRVPCLVDGSQTIWDSLAITEYLAEHHPGVWPAQATARHFARCVVAEMHSGFMGLRSACPLQCSVRVTLKTHAPQLLHDLQRLDALWCEGLNRFGGPFLAGADFSAADAFFAPVAFRVQTYQLPLSEQAMSYVHTLLALPAMTQWAQAALQEPWRDPAHEDPIKANAHTYQDLRV